MARLKSLFLSEKTEDGVQVEALKEISFQVWDNEFFAIVGPRGCGKSTVKHLARGGRKETLPPQGVFVKQEHRKQ